ncbi:antirestriction protein ArdC [Azospirillum fermentarium]|uniref:ArdC family protein n=1 Tax=Azospirillum fermentarium TaxID=1233114 RepID=UPI002227AB66|nr:zincin-like metallopeptidase domain-containing protein [Azospirillum fermentarium]MCW2247857.1 antirestriction protein ArdC [Azospirillum fermentarium]
MTSTSSKADIYTRITETIIAAIEAGAGDFRMPWHGAGDMSRPMNIISGKPYRGINTLALWAAGQEKGFASPVWGTYKQWQDKGAQVRKGEKSSLVVFWKISEAASSEEQDNEGEEQQGKARILARAYYVFNAAQVEGWEAPALPVLPPAERIAHAEAFFAGLGATIREGGTRACYIPSRDEIHIPPFAAFRDAVAYYTTLAHEATHWTAHPTRCASDLKGRFGSESYAAEELVAELGAAYLCADLGLASEPRPDHAAYIASWLKVLRNDSRAIFTAAARAQAAADWMHGRLVVKEGGTEEGERAAA